MSLFEYQAKTIEGQTVRGMVQAVSRELAVEILTDRSLTPIFVKEKKESKFGWLAATQIARIKTKDLVIFSRQLAVMSSATLPLVQALRILEKQTANPKLRVIVSEIADEVEGGAKLSASMQKYPNVFSDFYINMITSGETSGKLDDVLNYLADEQEKNYDLTSRIKGAMIYPAFILSGLLIVGAVMLIYVVPKLTAVLEEAGTELPLSTKILIGTSHFLAGYWLILLLGIVGLVVLFYSFVRTPRGKHIWHNVQLRIPIVGIIYKHIYLVRFTRSMHTLIVGGVPLTKALQIVSGVVGSAVYENLIRLTIKEVEDGNSIATIFQNSNVMPVMMSQMMIVGEKTGRLEEIFSRLSDFYAREVNNLVSNLVTLLEPMIMLVMGVAVGFMVSSILLPMYRLSGSI